MIPRIKGTQEAEVILHSAHCTTMPRLGIRSSTQRRVDHVSASAGGSAAHVSGGNTRAWRPGGRGRSRLTLHTA
eukprot:8498895-Prorocentrum_lima.AAC.1